MPGPAPHEVDPLRPQPALPRSRVLLAVFAGGCAGGLVRHVVTRAWPPPADGVPWSVVAVNVAGSLLLGLLVVLAAHALPAGSYLQPLLGPGFCGALTTFSAVTAGADRLAARGEVAAAAAFVALDVLGGLAAAVAGLLLGRAAIRARER